MAVSREDRKITAILLGYPHSSIRILKDLRHVIPESNRRLRGRIPATNRYLLIFKDLRYRNPSLRTDPAQNLLIILLLFALSQEKKPGGPLPGLSLSSAMNSRAHLIKLNDHLTLFVFSPKTLNSLDKNLSQTRDSMAKDEYKANRSRRRCKARKPEVIGHSGHAR